MNAPPLSSLTRVFSAAFPLFAAMSLPMGIGLGACGPTANNYYCDATGCFSCDGYGCTNVNPPNKQKCSGNASCPSGQVCTELGCSVVCRADAECPRGEVCASGKCAPPGTTPKPVECTTRSDCGASAICVAGKCQACGGGSGPCPCTQDAECGAGSVCQSNACVPKANVCQFASECAADESCVNGACVSSCANAACEAGFSCVKGACLPDPAGNTCSDDSQCGGNTPKCVSGRCTEACSADAQCGANRYCNQGACVPDTRPSPNCADDSQCGGGANPKRCVGGYCRFTCTSDTFCRSVDSRIGYCGKDGVCRNQQEANPQCTKQADCGPGKDCINNACR